MITQREKINVFLRYLLRIRISVAVYQTPILLISLHLDLTMTVAAKILRLRFLSSRIGLLACRIFMLQYSKSKH